MKKAERLEEIKCELGLMKANVKSKRDWYDEVIYILKAKVLHYQTVAMYLTNEHAFYYYNHMSEIEASFPANVPFGEGMLSTVAARGEISCEFEPSGQNIYIPFYSGHHLLGELIIQTNQFVDEYELAFLKDIQDILIESPS